MITTADRRCIAEMHRGNLFFRCIELHLTEHATSREEVLAAAAHVAERIARFTPPDDREWN